MRILFLAVLIAASLWLAPHAQAQAPPAPAAVAQAAAFDPIAATDAYVKTLSPEQKAKSDSYFQGGYILQFADFLYAVAVAVLLLWSGFSARTRDWSMRRTRLRWLQTALYALGYIVLVTVLSFPLTVYEQFFREHAYGLSNQNFLQWFRDFALAFGLSTMFVAFLITVIYGLVRRLEKSWWIWATGVVFLALIFFVMVTPVFVAPLFNAYKPLAEGPLKEEILSLARANGVPADQVWQFDASKQTTRISANVSGMLGTTRISLNDNLLTRCTPAEIRAVMAHEIGHYSLGHVYLLITDLTILAGIAFALINFAYRRLQRRYGVRWGVTGVGDPAGLPLVFGLFAFLLFIGTPVLNSTIRNVETQADIYGLNAAREPDAFATVSLKLAEYRKIDPLPLEEIIYYDHPSGRSRILMAMRWKAEQLRQATAAAK